MRLEKELSVLFDFLSLTQIQTVDTVVEQIAKEYKAILQNLYGNELAELVLYGSYARGEQHDESDVDFAIVLHNPAMRTATELFKIAPVSSRLSLKYGRMISSLPVSLQDKQTSMQGIFREIRKDGITV
ncbi:MAG: nucleotidyltransferase domain-containing protein [Flavisolibacter sp.]|nr:nucleotidyltransferase domain-containing protein [Flavisolibacter sp.]